MNRIYENEMKYLGLVATYILFILTMCYSETARDPSYEEMWYKVFIVVTVCHVLILLKWLYDTNFKLCSACKSRIPKDATICRQCTRVQPDMKTLED
jgi:hypothetical protein